MRARGGEKNVQLYNNRQYRGSLVIASNFWCLMLENGQLQSYVAKV